MTQTEISLRLNLRICQRTFAYFKSKTNIQLHGLPRIFVCRFRIERGYTWKLVIGIEYWIFVFILLLSDNLYQDGTPFTLCAMLYIKTRLRSGKRPSPFPRRPDNPPTLLQRGPTRLLPADRGLPCPDRLHGGRRHRRGGSEDERDIP